MSSGEIAGRPVGSVVVPSRNVVMDQIRGLAAVWVEAVSKPLQA